MIVMDVARRRKKKKMRVMTRMSNDDYDYFIRYYEISKSICVSYYLTYVKPFWDYLEKVDGDKK